MSPKDKTTKTRSKRLYDKKTADGWIKRSFWIRDPKHVAKIRKYIEKLNSVSPDPES